MYTIAPGISPKECRIEWQSSLTGVCGNGQWFNIGYLPMIEEMVAKYNIDFPDFKHWVGVRE